MHEKYCWQKSEREIEPSNKWHWWLNFTLSTFECRKSFSVTFLIKELPSLHTVWSVCNLLKGQYGI